MDAPDEIHPQRGQGLLLNKNAQCYCESNGYAFQKLEEFLTSAQKSNYLYLRIAWELQQKSATTDPSDYEQVVNTVAVINKKDLLLNILILSFEKYVTRLAICSWMCWKEKDDMGQM